MTRKDEVPLVFLGPSCPAEDMRAVLPDALIVPPVRRGDLYRYRLLNFGLFVLIDGVFTDTLAVSPREVVDVLQDGAAVVGAASMGALRAVDCAPAGARGVGTVYRLFRRGALGSEDEVAVLHLPDRPWPPVTQALVTIRVAARRTRRAGHMSRAEERSLVAAAESLGYDRRSWTAILRAARLDLTAAAEAALRASDIKREDAIRCGQWVTRRMAGDRLRAAPRPDPSAPLGRMGQQRERGPDPGLGQDPSALAPDFLGWLWCSGHHDAVPGLPDLVCALDRGDAGILSSLPVLADPDPDLAALLLRFIGFSRAVRAARESKLVPDADADSHARDEILKAHGGRSWDGIATRLSATPKLWSRLEQHRRDRALCLQFRKSILSYDTVPNPDACPVWHQPGTNGG